MTKHPNCKEECYIAAHKGYSTCGAPSGRCGLLDNAFDAMADDMTIEQMNEEENHYLNRQNARDVNKRIS
jgi:hypothetical protein